jgi:hypothetical protein
MIILRQMEECRKVKWIIHGGINSILCHANLVGLSIQHISVKVPRIIVEMSVYREECTI